LKLATFVAPPWARVQAHQQHFRGFVASVAQVRSQIGSIDGSGNLEDMPNQSLVVLCSVSRSSHAIQQIAVWAPLYPLAPDFNSVNSAGGPIKNQKKLLR